VIALFSFFQAHQVLLQVFLAGPGRAVDALQHLVLAVPTPVGACHFHEFEVLEFAGAGHVGAPAQVFKIAFAVQADFLIGRDAGNDFGLVMLAQASEIGHRLVTRQHPAHHRLILVGQLAHAFFNGHQVFGRERTAVGEIVIKTVVDHGTDGDLRFRKQVLDRIGQQVRCGMPNQLQTFRVLGGHDGQVGVARHAETGVHQLAIDLATQGRLGQAGTNG
jgi:hypothetical protein